MLALNLLQPDKIAELSNEFGLTDCKPLSSPLPAGCNLDIIKTTPPSSVKLPYHLIIGALLWVALASCPDILFVTIYLVCFLCGYGHTHFNAACHVLAYLHGTAKQTICYQRTPISSLALCHQSIPLPLIHANAKSFSGLIACLANSPIAWSSHLQSVVALSSTEAELIAITDAVCQAVYMHKLYNMLNLPLDNPMAVYCINQSTISEPPYAYHSRMKHLSIYDNIKSGQVNIIYVPTTDNLADFLTKAVPAIKPFGNKIKLNMIIHG